ncbi:hypothetical protein EYZ11_008583, partial [Aspergillus tanneri]
SVVLAKPVIPAMAQECHFPRHNFIATRQSELDFLSQNCTTLVGNLLIGANFSGPLRLPHITNITGNIRADEENPEATTEMSSIEMPDLEYLGGSMSLVETPRVRNVSMPRLVSLTSLSLAQPEDSVVDFSSLRNVNYSMSSIKVLTRP